MIVSKNKDFKEESNLASDVHENRREGDDSSEKTPVGEKEKKGFSQVMIVRAILLILFLSLFLLLIYQGKVFRFLDMNANAQEFSAPKKTKLADTSINSYRLLLLPNLFGGNITFSDLSTERKNCKNLLKDELKVFKQLSIYDSRKILPHHCFKDKSRQQVTYKSVLPQFVNFQLAIQEVKTKDHFGKRNLLKSIEESRLSALAKLILKSSLYAKENNERNIKLIVKKMIRTSILENFSSGSIIGKYGEQSNLKRVSVFLDEWLVLIKSRVDSELYQALLTYLSFYDFSLFNRPSIQELILKRENDLKINKKYGLSAVVLSQNEYENVSDYLSVWGTFDDFFFLGKDLPFDKENFERVLKKVEIPFWEKYLVLKYCSSLPKKERGDYKISKSCLKSQHGFFKLTPQNTNHKFISYFKLLSFGDYRASHL